ncbi:hypothetical protein A1351_19885 [Methylosinus sp. R-45379]|jgi:hypothetical protein|uniref:DUF3572 domain-containing protein n=1 Tax=unclassified Methylosinus TaxID=2624500 RepID=UPI00046690EB|nr:hypothetical protein A1351_19885 [Methylosinus sp. R-45379]
MKIDEMKIEKTRHRLGGEKRAAAPSKSDARSIALRSLVFLAADDDRMGRFLALTGVDPGDIRALMGEEGFQIALLAHICGDEPLLIDFASGENISPESVVAALAALSGPIMD